MEPGHSGRVDSYSGYAGLTLGYEVKLEQDGDRVTGVGRKVTENGAGIGPRAQTPLTVSGTIAGDRLTLTFVERGTQRETQGKFVLLVDNAANTAGPLLEQRGTIVRPRRSPSRFCAVNVSQRGVTETRW